VQGIGYGILFFLLLLHLQELTPSSRMQDHGIRWGNIVSCSQSYGVPAAVGLVVQPLPPLTAAARGAGAIVKVYGGEQYCTVRHFPPADNENDYRQSPSQDHGEADSRPMSAAGSTVSESNGPSSPQPLPAASGSAEDAAATVALQHDYACGQYGEHHLVTCWRLPAVNYFFNKATGESQLDRPVQQWRRLLAPGDLVRCRCESERCPIAGKYEKKRDASGSLVPLTSLRVRARFWVNEEYVGDIDDLTGPARFALQFMSQGDSVRVVSEKNLVLEALLRAAAAADAAYSSLVPAWGARAEGPGRGGREMQRGGEAEGEEAEAARCQVEEVGTVGEGTRARLQREKARARALQQMQTQREWERARGEVAAEALLQAPFSPSVLLRVLRREDLEALAQTGSALHLRPHEVVYYQGEGAPAAPAPAASTRGKKAKTQSVVPPPPRLDLPM